MGFAPSAGWAQALADQGPAVAGVPLERRVRPDVPPPRDFPVWGSIMDDIWAVEESEEQAGLIW
eukprot:7686424-Lingulodinium_polyedra.AAC.1